jgi:TonB family protein
VDFGIARIVDTSKTQTGVLLGTLAYMSPQLVKGERADERSDLWATGVVCYELFAGLKPFDGDNHAALLMSILTDEPRSLAKIAPDCPEELRVIVEKMLRKKAEERYQSFEELLQEIEPIWRRRQREWVDFLLAQSKDLVRKVELPEARKVLLQARAIDATRMLTRELLEKVNAALGSNLLPLEVAEHLEQARNLRSEGLLEEARAATKSALGLDSKCAEARQMLAEITRDLELLQEAKQSQRATAVDRLLTAMRAAIQRGSPSEAIRLGREALGRAGHDNRVSELVELAERRVREQSPPAGGKEPGELEIELYPKDDDREKLIREYVFERAAPQTEGSHGSAPNVSAQAGETSPANVSSRLASKSASAPASRERTTKKHATHRSGTLVLLQPTEASRIRRPWKRTLAYAALTIVVVGAAAAIEWKRLFPAESPAAIPVARTTATPAEEPPREEAAAPPRQANDATVEPVAKAAPKKSDEERLLGQAQQMAQSADSATLRQAQNLLDRVVAANGAHRNQAEELRGDVLRRLSKNEQELQRNQHFSSLATQARRDLDTGDTASARARLSEIQRLGGNDENLSAEIARTERARFASLESEYQQDAQSADERARNHLSDLQREFRALADSGGPLAANAKNYVEKLIPAKISEIDAKIAAANSNAAENRMFESAVKDYKKFLEARDLTSLKTVVLPKFQAIAQGRGTHSADARQYVDDLIPGAIRQLLPYPAIGCAEVPSGLGPSVKAGEMVACGLLDPPRLKWVQFNWPDFPARARQAGQSKGIAMLTLTVDENGKVLEAKPRGRSDPYGFADAAVQMARDWKTTPPRAQNKPVRTQFSVDVSFNQ